MPSPRQLIKSFDRGIVSGAGGADAAYDNLLVALIQIEKLGVISAKRFREVVQTVFRLARGREKLESVLGAEQISAAQDAFVRNLAETVIGRQRFLVLDVAGGRVKAIRSTARSACSLRRRPLEGSLRWTACLSIKPRFVNRSRERRSRHLPSGLVDQGEK